jgi:ribonuclease R
MDLQQSLQNLLSREEINPLTQREIVQHLNLNHGQKRKLANLLKTWTQEGRIVRVKGDRYCQPRNADLFTGKIHFRTSGAAVLVPEDQKNAEAIQIPRENTGTALHGDRVIVRLVRSRPQWQYRKGKRVKIAADTSKPTGQVIQILQRAQNRITGTLQKGARFYFVIPDDPRISLDVLVPDPRESNLIKQATPGDKVVVELDPWENAHINPTGKISDVLGRTHEPVAEFTALLLKYNLDPEFPDEVVRELEDIPDSVRPQDCRGREDLTKIGAFTIDPVDAKDFDDALSIQYLDQQQKEIGIHIADVSGYVRPNSALDREAKRRGNSTYLVGKVIPMLPEKLSNGLCSLVEGEVRLTKSVFLTVDAHGKILKHRFANSYIMSRKRLTYPQAYSLLKEDDLNKIRAIPQPSAHQTGAQGKPLKSLSDKELRDLQRDIRTLWSIAANFRKQRMNKGSLDLDMPEIKIYVDPQGYADRIVQIEHDESHQLVEEFMLAANETVAKECKHRRMPVIYRVHEKPSESKLSELSDFLGTFQLFPGDLTNRKHVVKLLQALKDHPQGHTLKIQFLRSLKQAHYDAEPLGHYGLHKEDYLHFTSPIRRYSDLIVHRVLNRIAELSKAKAGSSRPPYSQSQLAELAEHLSATEQNSSDAERESNKIKLLEYYERELQRDPPTIFKATVLELKGHGCFVELKDSLAFGFVPASSMRDDFYVMNQSGTELRGRKTGRRIVLGQEVSVTVAHVDRFKRQMDLRIVWP